MMPPPMTTLRRVGGSLTRAAPVLALVISAACSTTVVPPASIETPGPSPVATATPAPPETPQPTPTPEPTPRFTNAPDPELAALIPATAAGATITVPPVEEFGLTPGALSAAFGELANRFASLVVAYVPRPRATALYAVRVDGDPVTTADLEPHLATAGRYVGISGLHRDPWQLATAGGHLTWVRPEDNATSAGTMVYTWASSSGEFVFLLIGVDDALNQEILAALPGEPPPTPSPAAIGSPSATATASP